MLGNRVEKITSSYSLEEFNEKKIYLDTLKAELKLKRLSEAKEIRRKLTKMDSNLVTQNTLDNTKQDTQAVPHDKENPIKTPNSTKHDAPHKQTTKEAINDVFSKEFTDLAAKTKIANDDFNATRRKMINNRDAYFNNIFFLTFTTKKTHDQVLEKYGLTQSFWKKLCSSTHKSQVKEGNNKYISFRAKEAPEPADILWHNLSATACQKIGSRFLTFFMTFILIGIGFGIVLGLKVLQRNIGRNLTSSSQFSSAVIAFRGLSIVISFVVFCINTILPMLMRRLTQYERQTSNTDFFKSLTIKIALVKLYKEGSIYQHKSGHCYHPCYYHVSRCASMGQRSNTD